MGQIVRRRVRDGATELPPRVSPVGTTLSELCLRSVARAWLVADACSSPGALVLAETVTGALVGQPSVARWTPRDSLGNCRFRGRECPE